VIGRALIACLRFYQRVLSPLKGPTCRFHPTCSQYAIEALRAHGVLCGLRYATCRLLRCQPFARGGFDPVPPARRRRGNRARA
jgi:putative membrane protein insertion efficiency factor